MSNKCFTETDVPSQIASLKAFKTWRMVGPKLLGAVMIGLIEYLIRRRSQLLEREIFSINQGGRQLVDLIKSSNNSKREVNQRVKYIYSELETLDSRNNNLANELALSYLLKKGEQNSHIETQLKCFAGNFNVSIQLHSQQASKFYGQINVSSLIFYEKEKNYYFILQIAEQCVHCTKTEALAKMKCEHCICNSCLEQFFGNSKISSVKCEESGCSYNLTKEVYLQLVNKNQSKIQTQNSEIIVKEYTCSMCKSKQKNENILHLSCKHNICKHCVIKQMQNVKSQTCLMFQCQGKFIMDELNEIKRGLTYSEKQKLEQSCIKQKIEITDQKLLTEQESQIQISLKPEKKDEETDSQIQQLPEKQQKSASKIIKPSENLIQADQKKEVSEQSIVSELSTIKNQKCSRCKQYGFEEMYKSNCQHYYCRDCFLILNQQYYDFYCQEYGCGSSINEGAMRFIGTEEKKKEIEQQKTQNNLVSQKCSRCHKKFNVPELFYTQCNHFVCLCCIEYLAGHKYINCPYCRKKLDEQTVEDFYLEQQTQLLKKISQEGQSNIVPKENQQTFEQDYQYIEKLMYECECCHSPFSEYNIQQDLTCHNHSIGTCCIVFAVDCPKCQLGSITVHKSRLKFELQQNENQMQEEFAN